MKKIIIAAITVVMSFVSAVTLAGDKETKMATTTQETKITTTTMQSDVTEVSSLVEIEEVTSEKTEAETTTTTTEAETTTTTTEAETTTKAKTTKEEENNGSYSDYELELLAHLVYGESGAQSDECQIAVASVVLNRVNAREFPNTIERVIYQSGQYACTWDGNFDRTPSKRAYANARYVLEHGSQIPSSVIYQAQFTQGSGVYDVIDGEYFCYR